MRLPRTRIAIFVSLGLATAVPAATLGVWRAGQLRESNRIKTDRDVQSAAVALAHDVSRELLGHVRVAETLAEQIASLHAMDDPAQLQRLVAVERRHLAEAPVVLVANARGVSVACDPPFDEGGRANAGHDYSDRDYFREMIATGRTAVSRVQIGRITHRPNIQIAAPIHDAHGELLGYVSISLDPGLLQMEANSLSNSSGVRTIVLDRESRVLVHPDPAVRAETRALGEVGVFAAAAAGSGPRIELRSGLDENGEPGRFAIVTLDDPRWRVIAGRSWAQIDRDAKESLEVVLASMLVALLAGLAVATALSWALARPITDLARDVQRIREGDRRHGIVPRRFVTREVETLTVALCDLIAEVRTHEDHLEAMVADRTVSLEAANVEIAARLRDLEAAQSKLVESGRQAAFGQIAAGVAHEINNPASFVLSNLTFLDKSLAAPSRDADPDIEDLRVATRDALDGAVRIRDIVKDVKVLSRGDDRRESVFDMNDAVRSAIRICRGETLHRAEVKLDLQDGLLVKGSASALSQIFVNLVVNAAQAMPSGRRGTISVSARGCAGDVVLSVQDDAAGIAPEILGRVFEPFFTTKAEGHGVGLGLSIALETVRRHGGNITVASTVGAGTRFEISLPRAPPGEGDARDRDAARPGVA